MNTHRSTLILSAIIYEERNSSAKLTCTKLKQPHLHNTLDNTSHNIGSLYMRALANMGAHMNSQKTVCKTNRKMGRKAYCILYGK